MRHSTYVDCLLRLGAVGLILYLLSVCLQAYGERRVLSPDFRSYFAFLALWSSFALWMASHNPGLVEGTLLTLFL